MIWAMYFWNIYFVDMGVFSPKKIGVEKQTFTPQNGFREQNHGIPTKPY